MHRAANRGHTQVIKFLLGAGAPHGAQARHFRSYSPLHLAAQAGKVEAVALLLDAGADIDSNTKFGATPLHKSVEACHETVVSLLIARGADVEIIDADGRSPLQVSCETPHEEGVGTAMLLLQAGACPFDPGQLLYEAALAGNLPAAIGLLNRRGANIMKHVNERRTRQVTGRPRVVGTSPLHAASAWSVELTAELLRRGAEVNARDIRGRTPLFHACEAPCQQYVRIIHMLLDAGVEINLVDDEGVTPLHLACSPWYRYEFAAALIDAGADLDAKDAKGRTPEDMVDYDEDRYAEAFATARRERAGAAASAAAASAAACEGNAPAAGEAQVPTGEHVSVPSDEASATTVVAS